MARKRVTLAYIANDALRRITFKKRRSSLIKKVSELSTLCGVQACIVIYGPHEAKPEVWPSEPETRRILQRFRELPAPEQSKKTMNQEGFLQQRLRKHVEQLQKQEREVGELEMAVLMYEIMDGRSFYDIGMEDAVNLSYFIDMRLRALYEVAGNAKETSATAAAAPVANEQVVLGINGGGRMLQPYMDNEPSGILDPNLFNF